MNQPKPYHYTYSGKDREEIETIRKKYQKTEKTHDKLQELRALDKKASEAGTVPALILGILSTLFLGFGMSLFMTELASLLAISRPYLVGIAIGLVGMLGIFSAYPLYQWQNRRVKARLTPKILALSEELTKEEI